MNKKIFMGLIVVLIVFGIIYVVMKLMAPQGPEPVGMPMYLEQPASPEAPAVLMPAESPELLDETNIVSDPLWVKIDSVGGATTSDFEYKCPNGSYIDRFYMGAGQGVDKVQVRCNDPLASLSPEYGGTGGNPIYYTRTGGLSSYNVTAGNYVGNLTPGDYYASKGLAPGSGKATGPFAGTDHLLQCPNGYKIAGIHGGKRKNFLGKLGFWCQSFA